MLLLFKFLKVPNLFATHYVLKHLQKFKDICLEIVCPFSRMDSSLLKHDDWICLFNFGMCKKEMADNGWYHLLELRQETNESGG